jgi:hypothetical protein
MKHDLQQLAENAGLRVQSYSGRGMLGKYCLGISGQSVHRIYADLFFAMAQNTGAGDEDRLDTEEIAEAMMSARDDSLGRGIILYFPTVEFYDDGEDELESDE